MEVSPFAKWFVGGRLNVAYNCIDRHVEAGNGEAEDALDQCRYVRYRAEVCRN